MADWVRYGREKRSGSAWECPKCQMTHTTNWRVYQVQQGKRYQLWKGPHMIAVGSDPQALQNYAENDYTEGDLF